jgi:hypothetical protein
MYLSIPFHIAGQAMNMGHDGGKNLLGILVLLSDSLYKK